MIFPQHCRCFKICSKSAWYTRWPSIDPCLESLNNVGLANGALAFRLFQCESTESGGIVDKNLIVIRLMKAQQPDTSVVHVKSIGDYHSFVERNDYKKLTSAAFQPLLTVKNSSIAPCTRSYINNLISTP